MSSSRRKHHIDLNSGPLKGPRDGTRPSRSRYHDSALAGGNSTQTLSPASHQQQPLRSEAFLDRSRVQPNQSVLPSTNFRDSSNVQPGQSVLSPTKPEDIKMADKQRKYKSLTLAEQRQQDKWSQKKLVGYVGTCAMSYKPHHQAGYEGYMCLGGAHLVTYALLAEGKGGYYKVDLQRTSGSLQSGYNPAWLGPLYPGQDGGWDNAAGPYSRSSRMGSGGRMQVPGMTRDYGGGNKSSSLLSSKNFRDSSTAGLSSTSNNPPPAPLKEHPKDIPVSYIPNYGGRLAPNYKPHPRQGETDWTIYARPAVQNLKAERLEREKKLLAYPEGTANDPGYRANYRTIITQQDKTMAEKQLHIDTLNPAERAVQKEWAKSLLRKNGVCPEGFGWWTYNTNERGPDGCKLNGYRCWAGGHLVTHELLVEDQGRFFTPVTDEDDQDTWSGPVYPRVQNPWFTGAGGILNPADERGEPHWKDPNWRSAPFAPPWVRSSKSKKNKR